MSHHVATMSHHVTMSPLCRTISFISATCWFKVMCCLFLQRSEDVWSTHQYVHRRAFGAALGLLGLKVSGSLYLSRLSCQFSHGTPIDYTWYSTGGWDYFIRFIPAMESRLVCSHSWIYPWNGQGKSFACVPIVVGHDTSPHLGGNIPQDIH